MKNLDFSRNSIKKSLTAAILLASLLLSLMLQGCSKPPELESIRAELEALVAASYEINEIFFGEGLPVYSREQTGSGDNVYDENSGIYYSLLDDETYGTVLKYYDKEAKAYVYASAYGEPVEDSSAAGLVVGTDGLISLKSSATGYGEKTVWFKKLDSYTEKTVEYVYDDDSPLLYDYVRIDAEYQSVDQIKEAAEKVYSKDYLESIYTIMFDGLMTDDEIIYARYMSDESGNSEFFLKSNTFKPYFSVQTIYDLAEMKIVNPSRADYINVEVTAYGTYIDYEKLETATGTFKKVLKFVLEDGVWKLDTPTY